MEEILLIKFYQMRILSFFDCETKNLKGKECKRIKKRSTKILSIKKYLKSIQIRDQRDYKRKISPLKITKD